MGKIISTLLLLIGMTQITLGQVSITSTGSYTQNFNTLVNSGSGIWTDNSTIANWYAQRKGTGTSITASTGSINIGDLYSFGSTSSTERSLGSIGSGNAAAGHFAWGVLLKNNSGTTISDIKISYTGEQWRNSAADTQTVTFWYKISSSNITTLNPGTDNAGWTAVTGLDFTSPITGGTVGALDGNDAANRIVFSNVSIPGLSLPAGSYIMLRWSDIDHTGADHGLSIDDVTISYTVSSVSRTITTGTITGSPFCISNDVGAVVSVPYTITGTYDPGNIFTAQLSDATGDFSSPLNNIGSVTSTTAGTIPASIPRGTSSGTGYRIRVISSNHSVTGSANTSDLIINLGVHNVTSFSGTPGSSQVTLSWVNPLYCFDKIMIVAKESSSVTQAPTGDGSAYSNSLIFGNGTPFDEGYVVYKGLVSSQIVTNLVNNTPYYFKIFTRKDLSWSGGIEIMVTPSAPGTIYYSCNSGIQNITAVTTTQLWSTTRGGTGVIVFPLQSTNNYVIQNGNIVEINQGGSNEFDVGNITVEEGGKLWANSTTNTFLNVYGDIICNGQIGNGSNIDGIGFNINGAACTISGTGVMDVSRIKKETNTNVITNLTIARNINLSWYGTDIYNNTSGASAFNVTINPGVTVNCLGRSDAIGGNVSIDGTSGTGGTNCSGSFAINGTLKITGKLYLTNNNTTDACSFTINNGGVVEVDSVVCTASGAAGNVLTINDGGLLKITGYGFDRFSSTGNTYNINTGSIIEYANPNPNIINGFGPYSNLILTGAGNKTLGVNVAVNNELILQNGNLITGTNSITFGTVALNPEETLTSYILGTAIMSGRDIGNSSLEFLGVYFHPSLNALSNLSITRQTGTAYSNGGNSSINCSWNITSNNQPSSGILLDFLWLSVHDYLNNFTSTNGGLVWKSEDGGTGWSSVGTPQYVSGTDPRRITDINTTSFSIWTVSSQEAPLPVELASFTSSVIDRDVKLNWTTASEFNNAGFEIQKSEVNSKESPKRNGGQAEMWIKAGYENGSGTKTTPTNYSLEDKKLNTGKYKYRLKQTDYNGNFAYHNLEGVIEIGVPKKFELSQNYPNPFNPATKIDFNLPYNSRVSLKLFDISGREVMTLVNEQKPAGFYTVNFNGSNLASGVYFYRIVAGDFTAVKKLLLIK